MANVKKLQELDQRLERTESQLQVLQKISRLMARKLSLPQVLQALKPWRLRRSRSGQRRGNGGQVVRGRP